MLRPAPQGEAAGTGPSEDLKESALRLAFFLCGDRATALRIATSALSKLEIAASAQDKRLYYRPVRSEATGAGKILGFRRKVWLGEAHLLQRLVTIESEPHEREQERAEAVPPLSEAEAVVHFVKHLVRITLRRNSFYVALGMGRILHDYTTAQTRAAYDWLADGDGAKNDDYFRARKAVLLRELKERFGDALRSHRGPHGDERFETEQPPRHAALVAECLARFTPWGTPCLLPAGHATRAGTDQEREVERMHAILHPVCYATLARSLRLPPPAERLEIPMLFFGGGERGPDPPQERHDPPPLSREERRALDEELERQSRRRKSSSAGLLRVDVDGQRAARLDPDRADRVVLQLAPGAELVEIVAEDAESVPLAVHLLDEGPAAASGRFVFARTSRGRVRFSLRSDSTKGDEGGRTLEIALIPPLARRLRGWLAGPLPSWRALSPLLAVLVVGMAAVLLVTRQRLAPETGPPVPLQKSPGMAPTFPGVAPMVAPTPAVRPGISGTERAAERPPSVVPLHKVGRILFAIEGDGAEISEELARALVEGGLHRAHDRDEADALLKGSVRLSPNGVILTVELRDASGRVIWPVRGAARYEGAATDVARRVGRDLPLAIRAARGER